MRYRVKTIVELGLVKKVQLAHLNSRPRFFVFVFVFVFFVFFFGSLIIVSSSV